MTTGMRKRGRPLGSCKDDSPLLRLVADILQSDKKLKPTTAIKRVLASPDPSPIRRLQSKWKQDGTAYAKDARIRANRRAVDQTERIAAELERIAMQTANNGFGASVDATFRAQRQVHNTFDETKYINAIAEALQNAHRPLMSDMAQQTAILRSQKLLGGSLMEIGAARAVKEAEQKLIFDLQMAYNHGRSRGIV